MEDIYKKFSRIKVVRTNIYQLCLDEGLEHLDEMLKAEELTYR